jgi:hypothetical protein
MRPVKLCSRRTASTQVVKKHGNKKEIQERNEYESQNSLEQKCELQIVLQRAL